MRCSVCRTAVSDRNCFIALMGSTAACAMVFGADPGPALFSIMKSIMRWFASVWASEGRRPEGCGPAFALLRTASNSEESVVTPCSMRKREAKVKIATRVPGGMAFRYFIICEWT